MNILAIDTSTSHGSVAIIKDQNCIFEYTWAKNQSHAEILTPSIQQAMSQTNLDYKDLNAIAVGIGPGSFTGVRAAVNLAKSFSYLLKIKVFTLNSFEILMSENLVPPSGIKKAITIMDAFNQELFVSIYEFQNEKWNQVLAPSVYKIKNLENLVQEPMLCLGEAFQIHKKSLGEVIQKKLIYREGDIHYPRAQTLGLKSSQPNPNTQTLDWNQIQALYLKASAAEEKLRENSL